MKHTHEDCCECGEPVRIDRKHWRVHMTTSLVNVPADYDGDDSQGRFAIGPRCRKKYPHAFRADPTPKAKA